MSSVQQKQANGGRDIMVREGLLSGQRGALWSMASAVGVSPELRWTPRGHLSLLHLDYPPFLVKF